MKDLKKQNANKKYPSVQDLSKVTSSFPLVQEIWGILLMVSCVMASLSLLSFKQGDIEHHVLGLLGYYLAYGLHFLFGFGSYLLVTSLFSLGWKMLCNRLPSLLLLQVSYFILLLFSSCLLLNLSAELFPTFASFLGEYGYVETVTLYMPYPIKHIRYDLGGVPFYYLYRDLPLCNLYRLVSNFGTAVIAITFLLISFMLLSNSSWHQWWHFVSCKIQQIKLWQQKTWQRWKELRETKRAAKGTQKKQSIETFTDKAFIDLSAVEQELSFPAPYDSSSGQPLYETTPFVNRSPPVLPLVTEQKQKEYPYAAAIVLEKTPLSPEKLAPSYNDATDHLPALRKEKLPLSNKHLSRIATDPSLNPYTLPPVSILRVTRKTDETSLKHHLQKQAAVLKETLLSFGIEATVGEIHCGPRITSFEIHPAVGVKVQKIKVLENDIALNMQAASIRIIAPIPGKAAVGIEIPSPIAQEVGFRELIEDYHKASHKHHVPVLLGKNVSGQHVTADLTKMPHCIIAGATGSGKSVCINTLVISLLMTASPDDVKLLMIDPKKVELTPYSELPHMIAPVITEPNEACAALNWLVKEMEYRYEVLKQLGMRNIISFNHRTPNPAVESALEINIPDKMYYIVGIIDELADLMMVSSHDIETPIARIAQMARAVGIHLILATQRPSREVITGIIKANFPTRIAFKVASRVNSQIILDEIGAETLLGNGDMLFLPPGTSALMRAQGAYISDEEIQEIIQFICQQRRACYLIKSFDTAALKEEAGNKENGRPERRGDSLYEQAVQLVIETGNASTTFLQRKLKVGYARAASLIDELEQSGIIGPQEGNNKARKVMHAKHKNLNKKREEDYSDEMYSDPFEEETVS